MFDTHDVLKVKHKKSGSPIFIKADRFNPSFHEKISGENPMPISAFRRMMNQKKSPIILPKGVTVKSAPKKKPEDETGVPKNMFAARKWASEKGMQVSNKTTKKEIVEWAKANSV